MVQQETEPIVARASAPGRGGIGILRLSGAAQAIDSVAQTLFPGRRLRARHAHLANITDESGVFIDQVIAILFPAPHSYTAETVLEIQAHGGAALLQSLLERVLRAGRSVGLRLARPGEFTQRAFLNGRMDLTQAEAVADLIDAGSVSATRAAARSLQGRFSTLVKTLNSELLELRTYVEATLDFPEEDIDFIEKDKILSRVKNLLGRLRELDKQATRGKVLKDGLNVVLAGAPNVGKSSLMNILAGADVSIVTEVAGTTRDKIECEVTLDGMLVKLTDTAGLRVTDDAVESLGVGRAQKAVEVADVVLLLKDASDQSSASEEEVMRLLRPFLRQGVRTLKVVNKIDLEVSLGEATPDEVRISAKTGTGIDRLIERLKELAGANEPSEGDFLARTRHLECLSRAQSHLQVAIQNLETVNIELAAEELRLAGIALGEIVGETLPDDLLGKIFSTFCVGK